MELMSKRALTDLKTHGEVIADEMAGDPEFAAEWQRLALAREVAAELILSRGSSTWSQASRTRGSRR